MIPRPAAAATLDVPPDATPAAARAAFLRLVSAADFVPPESAVVAVNTLAGAAAPVSLTARADAAAVFREAVDEFADAYWTMPPHDRGPARAALAAAGPPPSDARFLEHFRRGEAIAEMPLDPAAAEHAGRVREWFAMRPRRRAARRAEWFQTVGRETARETVELLDRTSPEIAALDAGGYHDLPARWEDVCPAVTVTWPTDRGFQMVGTDGAEIRVSSGPTATVADASSVSSPQAVQSPWWLRKLLWAFSDGYPYWMVLFIVGCLIFGRDSSESTVPVPPKNADGPSRLRPAVPAGGEYTAAQLALFRAYDARPGRPAPPGYRDWAVGEAFRTVEAEKAGRSPATRR